MNQSVPIHWFQSKENQAIFLKYLQTLRDPGISTRSGGGERREGTQGTPADGQSFTLFVFSGDSVSLDELQSQIHLREGDMIERYSKDELRGVLTHLREIDPAEMENILQRFMKSGRFPNLKCLFLRIQSQMDLADDLLDIVEKNLEELREGEVKTVSF